MRDESRAGIARHRPTFPLEPLQRLIGLIGGTEIAWPDRRSRADRTALENWRRSLVRGHCTVQAADLIACSLGTHPAMIWGEAWFEPYLSAPSTRRRAA